MRTLRRALYVWVGFLVLSIGVWLLPVSQAAEPTPPPSPSPKQAQATESDEPMAKTGYLGAALGVVTASENIGTGLGYGGELSFFPQQYFGIGGLYRGGNHGTPKSNLYGAQILLRPIPAFTLGFVLGAATLTNEIPGAASSNSNTSFLYGGRVGYDFQLGSSIFTVGPEVDFLFFKPVANTVADINILGTFKIWL